MRVKIGNYPEKGTDREVSVHIDNYDIWNMDSTLALIIVPMLEKMLKDKHGAPVTDYKDAPKRLRPSKKEIKKLELGDTDKKFFKRWKWILKEMLFAFKSYNHDWEDQFYSGEHDIIWEDIPGTDYSEMKKGPKDTFKIDEKGLKAYIKRINNGTRLFGKYYGNLWT